MKHVILLNGERVPALGIGTWNMGDDRATRAEEIATLRLSLDLGSRLIDTVEMYGEGLSESPIGEAIAGWRDDVFLISKVYPHNASQRGIVAACERSLCRLDTDRLDLYLLRWRDDVPFEEAPGGLQVLQHEGKIRQYGMNNLDLSDIEGWRGAPGGDQTAVNQPLYNPGRRGIEWDVLSWLCERRVPMMAYSPIEQARLVRYPKLVRFVQACGMTSAQMALAWLLASDDAIATLKTGHCGHLRESIRALSHTLTAEQLATLDSIFPPSKGPRTPEML